MALDLDTQGFGERLSLALRVCNLSRTQFSAMLGIHKSLVSRWLSGQVTPTSYNIARMSAVFAELKPGFNMTAWAASQAEFEAALGLRTSSTNSNGLSAASGADERNAQAPAIPMAAARGQRIQFVLALAGGALLVALILIGSVLWRDVVQSPPAPRPAQTVAKAPSVAVMPFLNMSGDPAKEYLGDGIAEEILNDLANTPGLQVASRTSSFWFKGRKADIEEIAQKLNVRAILEGSVRQEGRRIRIVAQLIDATDGFHLWSSAYDRSIDDILSVQDEIARAIVGALTKQLLPRPTSEHPSPKTINPDAYDAYLQGLFSMNKSGAADLLRAVDFFKKAITLEPGYLEARARLAWVYTVLLTNDERRDTLAPARQQIAAVLKADPDNFQALMADAEVKHILWDWKAADATSRKLLRLHPTDAQVHYLRAAFLEDVGLWEKAVAEHRRAAELDPLVPAFRDTLGQALRFVHRDHQAVVLFKEVLALEPNFVLSLGNICQEYADAGNIQEAKRILYDKLIPLYGDDPNRFFCASVVAYREHDGPSLQKIAQSMEERYARNSLGPSVLAYPYAFMGDYDGALRWLEKAYDDRDTGVFFFVADPLVPAAMKHTLRWRALTHRPAFLELERMRAEIMARDG